MPTCTKIQLGITRRRELVLVGILGRLLSEIVESETVEFVCVGIDSFVEVDCHRWRECFGSCFQDCAVRESDWLVDYSHERA